MEHSIDLDHVAAHPIGALPAYANLAEFQPRRGSGEACFTPLNGSYHKVSTVAPFLLDCSGLLPIPGHVGAAGEAAMTPFWCQRNAAYDILSVCHVVVLIWRYRKGKGLSS